MNLEEYLQEDIGFGDITSDTLFTDEHVMAVIIAKQECIVAGVEDLVKLFNLFCLEVQAKVKDGDKVKAGTKIMIIQGEARSILKCERLALNIIMRMSGIATLTHELLTRCRKINPNIKIAATRKTTPGFRFYEKRAVVIGGGEAHRFQLSDAIMVKDNHLKIIGSIDEAMKRVNRVRFMKKIEIEATSEEEALKAAKFGADIIMLDNMTPQQVKKIGSKLKKLRPEIIIEVSGGITPDNIEGYVPYADVISMGWLTHSAPAMDFALDVIQ
ncbi:carboxylating nicotinate-nucleotide diphosphorylase [[Eubacterium] cellulosolvens]